MKKATFRIVGTAPYSQSQAHAEPKLDNGKEAHDAYDLRTWKSKMSHTEKGDVFIPCMSIKNCLSNAARFLQIKIPGKRMQTWGKPFEAGLMSVDNIMLGVKIDDVKVERVFVPADGRKGGGSRVWKNFPMIPEGWQGDATVYIVDDQIDQKTFEYHLAQAGLLVGLGRFRPQNGGFYGRFRHEKLAWSDVTA